MEAPDSSTPEQSNLLIAQAPLGEKSDGNNRILLTERSLQVYYRGKSRAFGLEYVQRLNIEHRKLWLPLLGGGILASLCLLALLQTFTIPYRLMAGIAVGLFGFWWGYRGSLALVVYEQRHHTDFLLPKLTEPLSVFVAFANRLIRQYPRPLGNYCMQLSGQEWALLQQQGFLLLAQPRNCEPEEEVHQKGLPPDVRWVCFDPFTMGEQLQWRLEGGSLKTYLQGRLPAKAMWLVSF